jgi:hypothetical protein
MLFDGVFKPSIERIFFSSLWLSPGTIFPTKESAMQCVSPISLSHPGKLRPPFISSAACVSFAKKKNTKISDLRRLIGFINSADYETKFFTND